MWRGEGESCLKLFRFLHLSMIEVKTKKWLVHLSAMMHGVHTVTTLSTGTCTHTPATAPQEQVKQKICHVSASDMGMHSRRDSQLPFTLIHCSGDVNSRDYFENSRALVKNISLHGFLQPSPTLSLGPPFPHSLSLGPSFPSSLSLSSFSLATHPVSSIPPDYQSTYLYRTR